MYNSLVSRIDQRMDRLFQRIAVPEDLSEVCGIDRAREVEPRAAGLDKEAAQQIWQAVENLYRTGYYPAVLFCLRRRGKIVFNRSLGHVHGNGPGEEGGRTAVLCTPRTPSCLFSASKAMTAMVLHHLEQEGEVNLLNPISYYIPEFAQNGKHRTTVYHLLSHSAGIPGLENIDDVRVILDHQRSVELLCAAHPKHLFGRSQAYHAVTGGVILAELVQRVTGQDIRRYWRRWFKQPMGFEVFDYGASQRVRARVTRQYLSGIQGCAMVDSLLRRAIGATLDNVQELMEETGFYRGIIAAANMVATAEELSAFYQMLLDDGVWQRQQILDPQTVHRATMETGPHRIDRTLGIPLRFSQGFMLGGSPFGIYGPETHHAFGHLGLVNNLSWADPEREISVALLVSGIPLLAGNLRPLVRMLSTISRSCPRSGRV